MIVQSHHGRKYPDFSREPLHSTVGVPLTFYYTIDAVVGVSRAVTSPALRNLRDHQQTDDCSVTPQEEIP
jgi:hypothetical protein